ncbi:SpdA protein, partial [Streptomyces sp.]|uniref:SpdA protein n=1 Tax=Streptomyces sp. TaxID=1931 RepID=UPI00281189DA
GGPRLWFLVALAASLGANVATAGLLDLDHVPASLRVIVAGWPAVAFFGGTLLAHAPRGGTEAPTVPASSSTDTCGERHPGPAVVDTSDRDALPAPSPEPEPKPAPEIAAEPVTAPAPASTPVPAVALPPVLVDRVRALADEHRSTTGHPADPDAVRARLGLPPSMTASVAAHL